MNWFVIASLAALPTWASAAVSALDTSPARATDSRLARWSAGTATATPSPVASLDGSRIASAGTDSPDSLPAPRVTSAGMPADRVSLETASVPEPSTWTLILAGLGVLGYVALRRPPE